MYSKRFEGSSSGLFAAVFFLNYFLIFSALVGFSTAGVYCFSTSVFGSSVAEAAFFLSALTALGGAGLR